MKRLISRFVDNVNMRRRISLNLFKLGDFLKNSNLGESAYIKHSDRFGIIALKFHRSRSHFSSDFFATVTVVVSFKNSLSLVAKGEGSTRKSYRVKCPLDF